MTISGCSDFTEITIFFQRCLDFPQMSTGHQRQHAIIVIHVITISAIHLIGY